MTAAIEAAMLEAHRAGLSVIPLGPGKRPTVKSWAEYQDAQPDELDVVRWGQHADGFAMICGGEQRVQVLDFERAFVEHYWRPFILGLDDDALVIFTNWLNGYDVITPTQGKHVAVHVMGDGDQDGNRPLARDADGRVLAETRGHGGYVVAAPSNGTTHPNGGQWVQNQGSFEQIAWATAEEWSMICAAIATFDAGYASVVAESPPEPVLSPAPGGLSLARIEHPNTWIEGVQLPSIGEILEQAGWKFLGSSRDGRDHYRRPDKDEDEASGNVHNNHLFVHSTNAAPLPHSPSLGNATFDVVDVIGYLTISGYDYRNKTQRTEVFRRYRTPIPQDAHIPVDIPVTPSAWLPDDFWEATPWLSEIRDTAWGNQACPEALFGCVQNSFAVELPNSIRLAATVSGATSPLNIYTTLCGGSGTGKSSILAVARKLLGVRDVSETYRYDVGINSGEGLRTAILIERPRKRGEVRMGPLPHHLGVQVVFDELAALSALASRNGDTSLSYLISAWTGGEGAMCGGFKAGGDYTWPADAVRVCAVFGVQYGVATDLFTGTTEAQGFPGRLMYFGMDHVGPKLVAGEQRPVRDLGLPHYSLAQGREIGVVSFPKRMQQEMIDWDYAGKTEGRAKIDGHLMLVRGRSTEVIALMDNSAHPEDLHWQLAYEVERHGLAQRARVLEAHHDVALAKVRHAGRMDVVRESARRDAWLEERARRLARKVSDADTPLNRRQQKDVFRGSDERHQLADIVEYALARGWVAYADASQSKALTEGVKPIR